MVHQRAVQSDVSSKYLQHHGCDQVHKANGNHKDDEKKV